MIPVVVVQLEVPLAFSSQILAPPTHQGGGGHFVFGSVDSVVVCILVCVIPCECVNF